MHRREKPGRNGSLARVRPPPPARGGERAIMPPFIVELLLAGRITPQEGESLVKEHRRRSQEIDATATKEALAIRGAFRMKRPRS